MDNYSDPNLPSTNSPSSEDNSKVKGRVRTKHQKVALLLSMGYPISLIAKETGLSKWRIYHLMSDPFVKMEINRITEETLRTRNLLVGELYLEALHRLDLMLESGDDKERDFAIDTIINLVLARRGRNGQPFISQYFNFQSQGNQESPESVDELIIRKRREWDLKVDKKTG